MHRRHGKLRSQTLHFPLPATGGGLSPNLVYNLAIIERAHSLFMSIEISDIYIYICSRGSRFMCTVFPVY